MDFQLKDKNLKGLYTKNETEEYTNSNSQENLENEFKVNVFICTKLCIYRIDWVF